MDLSRFKLLSFDCYGTLIDWEAGILGALRPLLKQPGKELSDSEVLALYAELEAQEEAGEYKPYRKVLGKVVQRLGRRLGFSPSAADVGSLAESVAGWLPFPDTVDALQRLKKRYRLVILSNIDDDLFAATARHLHVPFDFVITAQQCRSYKPSLNNFRTMLERAGVGADAILHCAESRFHDVAPARQLGIATVWVNRHANRPGASASGQGTARPDLEVPDLKRLADLAVPNS
ncbi:MAG TPA: haloacid dehalogenase type II [Terriglobales bacterium]|nr:haloacid dehalogenase type II [Terriglobales bacterium]